MSDKIKDWNWIKIVIIFFILFVLWCFFMNWVNPKDIPIEHNTEDFIINPSNDTDTVRIYPGIYPGTGCYCEYDFCMCVSMWSYSSEQ